MINVKELRIGNLVLIDYIESYKAIVMELPRLRVQKYNGESILVADSIVYPIPLTPELLQRCGFVWDENDYDGETLEYNKGCIGLYHDEDQPLTGWSIAILDDGSVNFSGHAIYFVHQLQNLYFALTGEELNVKL